VVRTVVVIVMVVTVMVVTVVPKQSFAGIPLDVPSHVMVVQCVDEGGGASAVGGVVVVVVVDAPAGSGGACELDGR
jgi:hypothetical protein